MSKTLSFLLNAFGLCLSGWIAFSSGQWVYAFWVSGLSQPSDEAFVLAITVGLCLMLASFIYGVVWLAIDCVKHLLARKKGLGL